MAKTNTDAIRELEQLAAAMKQQIAALEANISRIEKRLDDWSHRFW